MTALAITLGILALEVEGLGTIFELSRPSERDVPIHVHAL